ncbi:unnamed protein product, partial [Mesorhabditis belari]|uniref:THAP-type domain-containing protein n=1 Tax=Mesorhabditis belari TaxID=2138241 RepID=A0AAF3FKR3_9BILA
MPTTCGFPNCKFRSRYRGQEDNRHFYRIPKRPLVLRQRWLHAIGRTEETVVSQLRICSAHFEGGEKREGDIPVPDPTTDKQLSIPLPPKEPKTSQERRRVRVSPPIPRTLVPRKRILPDLFGHIQAARSGFNHQDASVVVVSHQAFVVVVVSQYFVVGLIHQAILLPGLWS